jgi:tRNA(fMet)-specific endonuclease VapC
LEGHLLAISFVTVAELYEGAFRARWGRRKRDLLETAIRRYVVVSSPHELCGRWGGIRYERRRQPIASDDAWIAATALVHDCPLVTHNPADFRGIAGLRVVSADT